MIKIVKVKGRSMEPLYFNKNYLVLIRNKKINVGDSVIYDSIKYGKISKQVSYIDKERKEVRLKGINRKSITSEEIGIVKLSEIEYKVLFAINGKSNKN